ncbi:MAG: hypothetical protein JSS72_11000 [Armatimonadetes bacterium]|nr:hypothetical protein [Armatimonadota bacterium]
MIVPLALALPLADGFNEAALQKLTAAEAREDIKALRTTLEKCHPGIYRYNPKSQMDRAFDEAERSIRQPMTSVQVFRIASKLVADMHCVHSGAILPEAVITEIKTKTPLFPIHVKVLRGKVYAYHAIGCEQYAGKEIRSINGMPAKSIMAQINEMKGHDGDVRTSTDSRMSKGWAFSEHLITCCGLYAPYRVEFAGSSAPVRLNGELEPKLSAIENTKYPTPKQGDINGSIRFEDGGKIAILKVIVFNGPLDKFFNEAFAKIAENHSKALIVDVRNNGGGADALGKDLFAHFALKPFPYYRDLVLNDDHFEFVDGQKLDVPKGLIVKGKDGYFHATGHPNWGTQQPQKPTFTGKVFVLINGGCFSTTGEFLSTTYQQKRATFIGEESGAGLQGNNSGPTAEVTLPHSKVQVVVPLMRYEMAVTSKSIRGIMPDRPVTYTIQEFMSGRDKEMEVALQLARQIH